MIHFTSHSGDYLLIPLPNEHRDRRYFMCPPSLNVLAYTHDDKETEFIKLPEGEWKMLAFTSSITEEQAAEIVNRTIQYEGGMCTSYKPGDVVGYKDYDPEAASYDLCFSALESLKTLLSFNTMEGEVLILKQVK